MKTLHSFFRRWAWFGLTLLGSTAHGQSIKTGPAVGQAVPEFSAKDQNSREYTLKSLMGPKGLMLVFFRSADW
jgi:hypothetical protein